MEIEEFASEINVTPLVDVMLVLLIYGYCTDDDRGV